MPTKVSIVKAMVFPVVIYTTWTLEHKEGYCCCLVTQLCLALCDPHGLQQARLPCPSLSPRVCSNLCPLSQWCHPTISSSVAPFSSCPQSFPASGFWWWCWNCGAGEESLGQQGNQTNHKGNQSWIFIERTDAETPILWSPDAKSWFIGKHPDAEKGWGQEEKGATEDEMIEWHHWLNGHEFEQTLGNSKGQGRLACYSQWVRKESDMTEPLNSNI